MTRIPLLLSFIAAFAFSALRTTAAEPAPSISIGRGPAVQPEGASPAMSAWNEAQFVFSGKLESVQAGPVGRSFPPVYTHTLGFDVYRVLRGDMKADARLVCSHVARQHNPPEFPVGKLCLVAASIARGTMRIERIEQADAQKIAAVELACSLPLGWRIKGGKPVSPWASLGNSAWPGQVGADVKLRCSKTGRPALLAASAVKINVEPVPPAKEIKWTNPDGDGEYKVTITNASDKAIAVPALLTDGESILWEESLVVLCQDKIYPCPGSKGVSAATKPAELQPGESVSTVVNALRLKGPEWPRGGYRIEFQFCLGELSETKSFYYLSRHHDRLRAAVAGD
ncbi:MAG: hypothetical protein H8E44_22125 [Planctomycetes bacterium]|nr:hypothetical protein [Planctomycetota bacterium]